MADWAALKREYITGETSYRELARRRGISYGVLCRRAAAEGWVQGRKAQRARDKLATLERAAEQAAQRIGEMLADEQQFHRHLVRYGRDGEFGVEERILAKVDTRALKDAVSAIKGMTQVMCEMKKLLGPGDGLQAAGAVILLPERAEQDSRP